MDTPSFYAILPAHIRYSTEISADEKLLYTEITALANKEGYCWATNRYFSRVFNVSVRTIQNRLAHLRDCSFITIIIDYVNGTKRVDKRKIYIADVPTIVPNSPSSQSTTPQQQSAAISEAPHEKPYTTPHESSFRSPREASCTTPHEASCIDNNRTKNKTSFNTTRKNTVYPTQSVKSKSSPQYINNFFMAAIEMEDTS